MKEVTSGSENPTLNAYQITTLIPVMQQSFYNPEYAADSAINPYEKLSAAIPSEDDVNAILDYIVALQKRMGGFGNEEASIPDSDARSGETAPTLTERQINVLSLIASRAAISFDFALQFVADPRPFMADYLLTDDDIANITDYINYVRYLINLRRGQDWF